VTLAPFGFDALVKLSDTDLVGLGITSQGARTKLLRELAEYQEQHLSHVDDAEAPPAEPKRMPSARVVVPETAVSSSSSSPQESRSEYVGYCLANPDDEKTPLLVTKDSMEYLELPPPPNTTLSAPPQEVAFTAEEIEPIPAQKSPKKPRPSLKVQISGVDFELEKDAKQSLSPFTAGDMLRRVVGPAPPSAPPNITAFGPTVDDDVNAMIEEMEASLRKKKKEKQRKKKKVSLERTTREERSGGMLSKILGRRTGSQ
jgi:hypothetical protein